MAITINHNTLVINVPRADLTEITPGVLYVLDTNAFRLSLHDLLDDPDGMPLPDAFRHNTAVTVAGVTYARTIEIINGYTVEFEDGQYAVSLVGSNNNIFAPGIIVRNQVSVISNNAAGLVQITSGSGLSTEQAEQLEDLHQFRGLDANNPLSITDATQTVAGKTVTVTDDGTTTTVDRS